MAIETSTVRESSTDVDVDDVNLEISSVWRTKKSKLEQHSTNAAHEILLVIKRKNHGSLNTSLFKQLVVFRFSDDFTAT